MPKDLYESPLSARYASKELSYLFSPQFKGLTFRKLWIALAKAEKNLGLPISDVQIQEMEAHKESIDFHAIERYEKKCKHDVMAHIHAFGDLCPQAKPILHLGATSCYVTDNTDLIQMKVALQLLSQKLLHVIDLLSSLAKKTKTSPCLSYTHYQPAQPTTFGKRICLWLQDFILDAKQWISLFTNLPFLGVKGATGTQASFFSLFDGDSLKMVTLEQEIAKEFGFSHLLPISGQTYTRKLDTFLLSAFASFAASCHKMCTDIRLLSHDGELQEGFSKDQVGSSAMPYKKNPIHSERICGLSRFVISLSENPLYTTATQWLERTLDDSSNRRLCIPEAFLATDGILNLLSHLISNLVFLEKNARVRLDAYLPLLCMENILMDAVKKGGNRQELHEKLRQIATASSLESCMKQIEEDSSFYLTQKDLIRLMDVNQLIGWAPQQVDDFLQNVVDPLLRQEFKQHPVIPPVEF